MVKTHQITKLEKMKTQNMNIQDHYSPVKGLNFATTIKWIPYLDLIASIEDAALKIPKTQANELRWKVRQALEKSKPPKTNISKSERLVIKSLQDDSNIIILPADKSNATVVMDRVEYSRKLADLISNGGYCKVKKDTTLKKGKETVKDPQ